MTQEKVSKEEAQLIIETTKEIVETFPKVWKDELEEKLIKTLKEKILTIMGKFLGRLKNETKNKKTNREL